MQETKLPNKKEWADQLEATRVVNKINNQELADLSGMSHVTLMKVVQGKSSYENMKKVENALRGYLYGTS
jgi:predicted transcriptional regulator